jgi:mannose-6-phosphate isomerase class I
MTPTLEGASFRTSSQPLAPVEHEPEKPGTYDLYPGFPIGSGKIFSEISSLASRLAAERRVVIDGYGGVLWEDLRSRLDDALRLLRLRANWIDVSTALRSPSEVDSIVAPFLGGDDPLWGTRFTGGLADFFDPARLDALAQRIDPAADIDIFYGTGAALASAEGHLVYVDVPKNEIQYRSRAGAITNIGAAAAARPKAMYKRFYFVDWVALNRHKERILPRIGTLIDGQRPEALLWIDGDDLRAALDLMSGNWLRVRPWFEPGPWGGRWIKEHIPQAPQDVDNYAWSFEMIAPENGLMLESDRLLLEVSFDLVMFRAHRRVLGDAAERFGTEFPIRFDFLDTFDGGNLSVQCHPRPEYISREFGERFTQDETYYILDAGPGATVYLGFTEECDPDELRAELERSFAEGTRVDIERYVNVEPAQRHGLYLIPNGTIHCSGVDNLVLEISATPYIFTFKMYDWLRLDLDGTPRPLNIARAWENLYFDRRGDRIRAEFISRPHVIAEGPDWRVVHLPTHREHFYDVHRLELATSIEVRTDGKCHVMSLVEGSSVILETAGGMRQRFNYAETFVVPAAAGEYRLVNEGTGTAMVVQAFVK